MHVRYVVLNNDEEPLMEYDLNGICETEDSIYCTRVPSGGGICCLEHFVSDGKFLRRDFR